MWNPLGDWKVAGRAFEEKITGQTKALKALMEAL